MPRVSMKSFTCLQSSCFLAWFRIGFMPRGTHSLFFVAKDKAASGGTLMYEGVGQNPSK
jgi:hypothetical protein